MDESDWLLQLALGPALYKHRRRRSVIHQLLSTYSSRLLSQIKYLIRWRIFLQPTSQSEHAVHSNEYSCRGGAYRKHTVQHVSKRVPSASIVPFVLVLISVGTNK